MPDIDQQPSAIGSLLEPSVQPPEAFEEQLTKLDDFPKRRQMIFDRTQAAVLRAFPVSNATHELRVTDVRYSGPDHYTKAEWKKALLNNQTLSRKLSGNFELVDKATGKTLQKSGRKTLMNVPYLTDTGTFVRNGVEYGIPLQLRMRPGVYTHFTSDGYPEAQVNVKPGTGSGFRIHMDPESSIFFLTQGTRKVPLYPILQAMQVPDEAMEKKWGKDILQANRSQRVSPHAVRWINETVAKGQKYMAYAVGKAAEPEPQEEGDSVDEPVSTEAE